MTFLYGSFAAIVMPFLRTTYPHFLLVPATALHTPGFDLAYPLVLWAQPSVAPGNEELNFLFVKWIGTKTVLFNLAGRNR